MIITHKIKMDLTHKGIAPNIHMVQGDYCSRNIQLQLFSEHTPWHIPKNTIALIRYCRPDHSVGAYDTLPDGSCAYVISGNTVTIGIAPEALAIAGTVSLVVTLANAEQELTTFVLLLEVQPNLTSGPMASGDYASITGMVQIPDQAEVGQALVVAAVNEYGKPTLWETVVLPKIPEDHVPLDGSKEMTGNLKVPGIQLSGNAVGDPPPCVHLLYDGAEIGSISADPDAHQLLLTQVSADTAMEEVYKTPAPASGITEAKQYELLTTRDAITLSQGGTGATTAEDARKNLGAASQADMLNIENRLLKAESMDCSVISSASGEVITVHDASDHALKGLTLYGKTIQNGTPTPDTPIDLVSAGDSGSIGVNVCGKNLFNIVGTGYLSNMDGSITALTASNVTDYIPIAEGVSQITYLVPNYTSGMENVFTIRIGWYDEGYGWLKNNTLGAPRQVYDVPSGAKYFRCSAVSTANVCVMYGEQTISDYEPYISGSTLTAQTSNGLPGIPVSSGGNYTDANDQQWICDEIDFAKGVYVQRVLEKRITEFISSSVSSAPYRFRTDSFEQRIKPLIGLCNITTHSGTPWGTGAGLSTNVETDGHGIMYINLPDKFTTVDEINAYAAEKPIMVLAALETPIETPLSAEEIAAFKALHTNKPNTTVCTDSNAGIKLDYVADTKTYIDNKFAELAAIVANA